MPSAPPPATRATTPRPSALQLACFALIVLAGVAIRVWGLSTQLLGDDEWHSLHTLMTQSYGWIATHFGANDYCIPLTLFEKFCGDTFGISELEPRLVPLAFGIAGLVALPLLCAERLGWRVALVFAALLAISPLAIHYARIGRPYSVSFTCAFAAVLVFDRWWRAGGTRWAVLFVACSALATWFHLTSIAFVAPVFAWALWQRRRGAPGRSLGALAGTAVALALAVAALTGPALVADSAGLAQRSLGQSARIADAAQVLELWRGLANAPLTFVFGVALVWGSIALWQRERAFAVLLAAATAGSLALVAIARPAVADSAVVVARYMLPVLGIVLVVASAGLLHLEELVRREFPRWPAGIGAAVFVVLAAFFGPLPSIYRTRNDWTNHAAFQAGYSENFFYAYARRTLGITNVPGIYELLAREGGPDEAIVEAPWNYESSLNPSALFQRVHQRPIFAGFVTPPGAPLPLGEVAADDARFRLRRCLFVRDIESLRAHGVRHVVFQRKPPFGLVDDRHPRLADVEALIELYRARVGGPRHEDENVCVFDLGRVAR